MRATALGGQEGPSSPFFLLDPTRLVPCCSSTELPAKSKCRRSRGDADAVFFNSLSPSPWPQSSCRMEGCLEKVVFCSRVGGARNLVIFMQPTVMKSPQRAQDSKGD